MSCLWNLTASWLALVVGKFVILPSELGEASESLDRKPG
jgi:hypothetical protein